MSHGGDSATDEIMASSFCKACQLRTARYTCSRGHGGRECNLKRRFSSGER